MLKNKDDFEYRLHCGVMAKIFLDKLMKMRESKEMKDQLDEEELISSGKKGKLSKLCEAMSEPIPSTRAKRHSPSVSVL